MLKLYVADTGLISDPQVYDRFLSKVNEQRRAKVLRCKNEEDRRCSLLAGVLLRYGLEQEGMDYDALEFSVTQEKKPVLVSHPKIHFSISHSGNRAACLISDRQAGVDLENKNRRLFAAGQKKRLMTVAGRIFTEKEYDAFLNAPEDKRQEFFLKAWTRKEAVSKAAGKGLAMDFSKIDEAEENYLSFWLDEAYYISIYVEEKIEEELELCMMN